MRIRASIWVAILAVSFTLVAAQSATTDPAVAPNKIEVMRPPLPAPVYVLNFPDVQPVSGVVSVDNLPAVQTIGGTVNVGNLPLDADGAVRVTSAPIREPVLIELVPEGVPVQSMSRYFSPVVDVAGYSKVGIQSSGNWNAAYPTWRWAGAPLDDFAGVTNWGETHSANGDCGSPGNGTRHICLVSGVQLRFELWNNTNVPVMVGPIRVYLIP